MPETHGRPTVARWWAEYAERIVPAHASRVQVQESKRAFYAGAVSMLDAIISGLSAGDEPTDEDEAHLDRLNAELVQFANDVKAGRA